MASFYNNNYYQYYRPYSPHMSKHHPFEDKSSHRDNNFIKETAKVSDTSSEKNEKSSSF